MSYGKIYETTWWGNPVTDGWGGVYAALSSDPTEFRFTVKTDNAGTSNNDQFTLPLDSSFSSITAKVDWGDGNTDDITTYNQSEVTHTYSSAGTYTIKITNALKGWKFDNGGDKLKMLDIQNWGVLDINTTKTFNGCDNLTQSATDAPTITTTSLASCFKDTGGFNGAVGNWDVSTVNTMAQMFRNTTAFNQDLSSWNIVNVSNGNNFLLGNDTLSTANYDALLIGWEATLQAAFSGGTGYSLTPTWRFGSAQYTDGGSSATARARMGRGGGWGVGGGGGGRG